MPWTKGWTSAEVKEPMSLEKAQRLIVSRVSRVRSPGTSTGSSAAAAASHFETSSSAAPSIVAW